MHGCIPLWSCSGPASRYTNKFRPRPGRRGCDFRAWRVAMVEPMLIDLKALLVEREDCDAGTVQKIREALAQGGPQYRTLRDVTETLKKKAEAATGASAKRWQLKLGIAKFFLGHLGEAAERS